MLRHPAYFGFAALIFGAALGVAAISVRAQPAPGMREHADGGGRPGVVINYNCMKFRCPEGMVERLATIVRAYPDFVYLAPYPEMDVRIAVTKLGKLLTLDEPDLEKIRAFITE